MTTRRFVVRHADADGKAVTSTIELEADEDVQVGGVVYYTDTDSILTNVELSSSNKLGEMKDEYPGEWLKFHAVQPKVYMIERTGLAKVTMKGFPMAMRTKENLARLEAGEVLRKLPNAVWHRVKVKSGRFEGAEGSIVGKETIDGEDLWRVDLGEAGSHTFKDDDLESLQEWRRLEKIRSLARVGFHRPPRMTNVEKSFRSKYDKRRSVDEWGVPFPDANTRAIVLDEPIGGYPEDDERD